jgi:hypothetical protein
MPALAPEPHFPVPPAATRPPPSSARSFWNHHRSDLLPALRWLRHKVIRRAASRAPPHPPRNPPSLAHLTRSPRPPPPLPQERYLMHVATQGQVWLPGLPGLIGIRSSADQLPTSGPQSGTASPPLSRCHLPTPSSRPRRPSPTATCRPTRGGCTGGARCGSTWRCLATCGRWWRRWWVAGAETGRSEGTGEEGRESGRAGHSVGLVRCMMQGAFAGVVWAARWRAALMGTARVAHKLSATERPCPLTLPSTPSAEPAGSVTPAARRGGVYGRRGADVVRPPVQGHAALPHGHPWAAVVRMRWPATGRASVRAAALVASLHLQCSRQSPKAPR